MTKLCFIGNCQAAYFSSLASSFCSEVCVSNLKEAYLAADEDLAIFLKEFQSADIIISRHMMSSKVPEFVRTNWLRKEYPNKIVVVPNIYFNGLDPDTIRIYKHGNIVRSVLGDYHSNMIAYAFREGWDQDKCIWLLKSDEVLNWYPHSVENSIKEQKIREDHCDIIISDFIEEKYRDMRLFYVNNHPTSLTLNTAFKRIMCRVGIKFNIPAEEDLSEIELSHVVFPIHPAIRDRYKLTFWPAAFEYATKFDKSNTNVENPIYGDMSYLSLETIVDRYYRLYDQERPFDC